MVSLGRKEREEEVGRGRRRGRDREKGKGEGEGEGYGTGNTYSNIYLPNFGGKFLLIVEQSYIYIFFF